MKRSIEKQVTIGHSVIEKSMPRDLKLEEVNELLGYPADYEGKIPRVLFEAVTRAFYMGVAVGHAIGKEEQGV